MTDSRVLRLPLPDEGARSKIGTDLDSNLLVEAGAGSGKTTALVGRMVALLETGTATADEIAAVTFTRKAAGELRERFQIAIEERLARRRTLGEGDGVASELLAQGLDEIDRAFIGTIHAFCARLLRERPLEVGLDPGFEEMEVEERITLRRRFWQSYLERLARQSDPLLEELARAGLKPIALSGLFDQIVENPDVDFPAEVATPGSPEELAAIRAQLEVLVDRAWELMPDREPDPEWDSLQKKVRTIHFSRDVTGWTEPADLYEAIGLLCKPGPNGHSLTQKRWRNGAQAKALRDEIDVFAVGDTPARRLYTRWLAHRYTLAVRLARQAADEFTSHRRRIGKLDFQDLLVLAADLLRANPAVRRDLGTRYRRLLVDEFQDTDPLQAEIMLLLASEPAEPPATLDPAVPRPEWMTATPRAGGLFVVGDPKQSIYRFRRADIQLYGYVKSRFREFGAVVELTSNFRSRPPIGDLVNELFPTAGFFPPEATPEQAGFEPLNTRPPLQPVPAEGVFTYEVTPLKANAAAAARDDASRLACWIRGRLDRGERQAGDFLVLTYRKARMDAYARALESYGVPMEVTGAGVGAEEEIRELQVVLECLIDPGNPVRVVAALVGICFGIDYERLIEHRLEGGGFDAMRPGERGHPDVLAALRVIHGWWRTASAQPSDVFVPKLVSEIGLLPLSAARDLGAQRAGSLVFALDSVRAAALAGDASLPGAIIAMEAALALAEAEAPIEPGRPDVVRLMNLHQAKGLEATVVVLADTYGGRPRDPESHVTRAATGRASGYARVFEASESWGPGRDLARPEAWDEMAVVEQRFAAAEDIRLLYVAVTRAKEELVVARFPQKADESFWRALHPWLERRATRLEMPVTDPPPRAEIGVGVATEVERSVLDATRALIAMREPTYRHVPVTSVAKSEASEAQGSVGSGGGTGGAARLRSDELRGFSWGSAVHGALAAAARAPGVEPLRATCRDLLVEYGRPLDDHGEPIELDELSDLVRTVQTSELWTRAMRAERVLAEVPFAVPFWRAESPSDDGGKRGRDSTDRPQLDLSGGSAPARPPDAATDRAPTPSEPAEAAASPVVLEGVIDLAFLEGGKWVIADYKTDVGTDPEFAARSASYRRQVDLYAEAWSRLTGESIKERVLFFTAHGEGGREVRW
jgi:ATP-dependent helicase/nuclease subunit A